MGYPVAQPGAARKNYVSASMSANQTSNLGTGNHIEFDTVQGTIPMQTGVGQANGIFELSAGRTYRLSTNCLFSYSVASAQTNFVWYDRTNGANLTEPSIAVSVGSTSGWNATTNNTLVVTPTTDIEVEVRLTFSTNVNDISLRTTAYIEELEAFIPAIDSAKNFSTGEVDTGARWIDGKTIYRKVIDIGTLPNATTADTAHGITTIDTLISLIGTADNGTTQIPIPTPSTTAANSLTAEIVNAPTPAVRVGSGANYSSYTGYVVLEYTKV